MVALIPSPDPMNMHCFLEPLVKELDMYGPLIRNRNESLPDYKTRVKNTKRAHTLRVSTVRPLNEDEDPTEAISNFACNEWCGIDRPPCSKSIVVVEDVKYLVAELDVILFLVAITCDMPQRDKTMNRGGTARTVGCAWCLLEVSVLPSKM